MVPPPDLSKAPPGEVIRVTRKESLVRLLDTAILFWFEEREPLSTHVVISAAYNVLEALGSKTGKGPQLKNASDRRKLTLAYDFLRHASSSQLDALDFPLRLNALLLADAIGAFQRIFGETTANMHAFSAYYLIAVEPHQEIEVAAKALPDGISVIDTLNWSKREYFERARIAFRNTFSQKSSRFHIEKS